jgi:hypothetical protein
VRRRGRRPRGDGDVEGFLGGPVPGYLARELCDGLGREVADGKDAS